MNTLLTIKEAAARARVSETIVRGWVRDGSLPHYRLGAKGKRGKIAIAPEDLDALVASFRVVVVQVKPPERKPPSGQPVLKHLRLKPR
ncbi:helix-turn-helix domain-containing protein [Gemmata sp. JC717]|uniref:helix-turn-helix domain-containing protein n=1 Tax=Gemmata algarum TaxID=2975278 RepID=UPI0021BB96F5|nr:helix-turn-helix domain-containing protein [Gemmata algarum]MDY3551486.1 helix-turn-helix domain-containing protein [Gemmata algarum]